MSKTYDYIIIGAGVIGLAIAKRLLEVDSSAMIGFLEKEADVAHHGSGRNSGVLHAGFYYTSDSLKAKFTADGNRYMTEYCIKNKLKINKCMKLVVAKDEMELATLYELEKRGIKNGVNVRLIDEKDVLKIDSNVKTFKKALLSPDTSTVDPIEVCSSFKNDLLALGVDFFFNEGFSSLEQSGNIRTTKNRTFAAKKIINCAGLYADKIAKEFGFSQNYVIIPFKGIYLKYTLQDQPLKINVYPVPNLKNPFLGVHYTITVNNEIKIGPTSIPAFWRENYNGFKNFKLNEFVQIISWEAKLFLLNSFGFRSLAFDEIKKYSKSYFINLASKLVFRVKANGFNKWSTPGIRAQLLNVSTNELVQDFVVEGDTMSVHILNAVSPAFTASLPFAKWVVENYILNLSTNNTLGSLQQDGQI